MPLPEPELIQAISVDMAVDPSFVEKDWHAVQLIALIADLDCPGFRPIFSGGTSLSKAYGLIQRFSEDVDYKVMAPEDTTRPDRREFRRSIIEALRGAGYKVKEDEMTMRDSSRFFSIPLAYGPVFQPASGLRSELKLEMSIKKVHLPAEVRPVGSFVARAHKEPEEAPGVDCVSPVETAADKLSALTSRTLRRLYGDPGDDPAEIRHLHDLAALEEHIHENEEFRPLILEVLMQDVGRCPPNTRNLPPLGRLSLAVETMKQNAQYEGEYEEFVMSMSYAPTGATPPYADALSSVERVTAALPEDE